MFSILSGLGLLSKTVFLVLVLPPPKGRLKRLRSANFTGLIRRRKRYLHFAAAGAVGREIGRRETEFGSFYGVEIAAGRVARFDDVADASAV